MICDNADPDWVTLVPPSDPVQPDDPLDYGVLGNTIRLADTSSTIDGAYCYIYE